MSKVPREASGDEELAAHRPLLQTRSSAARGQPPAMGTRPPPPRGGTRGTRGTRTSSRGLWGRILPFRRQRASWSAGQARGTSPFHTVETSTPLRTAGCRSSLFLRVWGGGQPGGPGSARHPSAKLPSRPALRPGHEGAAGQRERVRGQGRRRRRARGPVRPGRARAHCLSESLRFTDMHRHCFTFWIFLSRKGGSSPGQSSSTSTEATRCGRQKAQDWKDASSRRTWRGM